MDKVLEIKRVLIEADCIRPEQHRCFIIEVINPYKIDDSGITSICLENSSEFIPLVKTGSKISFETGKINIW